MAWKREKKTSDGRLYYEFRCHPTRGGPEHCERWYFPDGWSRARIERASDKALTDFEQRVRSGEHQTQKEIAQQAAIEAENEEKKETVGNYVETVYFKTVELSENARASYEAQLRLHILPYIGDKKVSEVKPEDIELIFQKRKESGCSYESELKVYTVLRSVFNSIFEKHMKDNPMLEVKRPKKNSRKELSYLSNDETLLKDKNEVEAYTKDELIAILEAIKNEPLKWQMYISILADTGMRRGECTALKWSCINLRTGEVLIEESVGYTKDKGVYRCPPKGNKPRTVSISKRTMQMLFVWKEDQKKRGIVSQYVFTRSDGPEIMFPTTPTKHLKEIGKRCGIEDLHPHKLRHTFASVNLLEGIGDIETIAEILGHSDVSTTLKVYTHASEESKRKMSQSFHDTIHKK